MARCYTLDLETLQPRPVDGSKIVQRVPARGQAPVYVAQVPSSAPTTDTQPPSYAAGGWRLGDPFPTQVSECGWALKGYVAQLQDPQPCFGSPKLMPWVLKSASASTVRLKDGRMRMYMPTPRLQGLFEDRNPAWPAPSNGSLRLSRASDRSEITDPDELKRWWKAWSPINEPPVDPTSLHFSRDFIAFMDSADGLNWTLYAPDTEEEDPEAACKDVGRPQVFKRGPFRAGWHSTSIRCSGGPIVYHDPTVIYVEALDRYLMFVVECEARGVATNKFAVPPQIVEDNDACSICTGGACTDKNGREIPYHSSTRVVFFICADADFQQDVMGPFWANDIAVDASRPTAGPAKFIGVPQAFLDPKEENFYLFIGDPTKIPEDSGLHVMQIGTLHSILEKFELNWKRGDRRSARGSNEFYDNLKVLGDPTPQQGQPANPILTDQHFFFCEHSLQLCGPLQVDLLSVRQYPFSPSTAWGSVPILCDTYCICLSVNIFGAAQIRISNHNQDIRFNDPWVATATDMRLGLPKLVMYLNCDAAGGLLYAVAPLRRGCLTC
jgi:hypothetical protein